jgi:hypothetical protein
MKKAAGANTLSQRLGLDPTVALGLVGVLIFFVINGLVAYFNLQTLRDDNEKIVHSHDVIVALDTVLSDAQDAETGQRGFLRFSADGGDLLRHDASIRQHHLRGDHIVERQSEPPLGAQCPNSRSRASKLEEYLRLAALHGTGTRITSWLPVFQPGDN